MIIAGRGSSAGRCSAAIIVIAVGFLLGGCPMDGADGMDDAAGQPAQAVPGQQGPAGTQGEQGPQGDFGLQGSQGEAGLVGDTGPQGEAGLEGEAGPQGATGLQGEMGVQGEAGPPGELGLSGPPGASPFTLIGLDAVYTQGNVGIGTNAPTVRLDVVGGESSMAFDTETTGDASVILPADAISAAETLNEPGVAGTNTDAGITLNSFVVALLERTITVPANGYVLAIATGQVTADHVNGNHTAADFGVSDTAGVLPPTQQVGFLIPGNYPTGNLLVPVTVQTIFTVEAGANTFYFLGNELDGNVTVSDMTLSLIYFPTAYGRVELP